MHRILWIIPIGNGVPIFSYGLFLMIGFIAGLAIAWRRARRFGLSGDAALDIGLLSVVGGVVGARLAFLFIDYDPSIGDGGGPLEWIGVWRGGLTFQGGLILATLIAWAYMYFRKIPVGGMLDAFAPGLAVGVGFGRIGCYFNGCCWGAPAPASFPLGVVFPPDIEPMANQFAAAAAWPNEWAHFAENLGYNPAVTPPIPLYPTQLASAAGLFLIAAGLLLAERIWKRRADGQVVLWFVFAYSIGRFVVEFWRDDTPLRYGFGAFPGLRLGQWLGVAMFAVGIAFQLWLNRIDRTAMPPDGKP